MLEAKVGLMLSTDSDPAETARWVTAFNKAMAEEAQQERAARDANDEVEVEHAADGAVDELVQRWVNYKPNNAENIRAAVKSLRAFGYTLALSEPRSSAAGSRTYLRALRPDGLNIGYLNSTSFAFVGAAALVQDAPGIHPGRYPYIPWSEPGSIELVVNIANQFLAT